MGLKNCVKIESCNNFPDTAGLASSSSAYSALELDDNQIQQLARIGSGSAIRSLNGGFVEWKCGTPDLYSDSLAFQIFDNDHWPDLRILIIQVSSNTKSINSSIAMERSLQTSELLKLRTDDKMAEKRISLLKTAIKDLDFESFGQIVMKESQTLHAICLDTYPPIEPPYLSTVSHRIMQFVHELNSYIGKIISAYTFDAGSNAFIFIKEENIQIFLNFFLSIFKPVNSKYFLINSDFFLDDFIRKYKLELPFKDSVSVYCTIIR